MAKFLIRAQYSPQGLQGAVRKASPAAKSTFAVSPSHSGAKRKLGISVTAKTTWW